MCTDDMQYQAVCIVKWAFYSVKCEVCSVHHAVSSVQCAVFSIQYTVYDLVNDDIMCSK